MADTSKLSKAFSKAASAIAHATGRPSTFVLCCAIVIVWAVSGPVFGFSDTWQLVINTGTTIVTFLMVFLIQNTQNRDGAAIQAKLDELIRASTAQNAFVGIEHLTEEELDEIRRKCEERAVREGVALDDKRGASSAADVAQQRADRRAAAAIEEST
jgi:low affinity Fe/Cu permease